MACKMPCSAASLLPFRATIHTALPSAAWSPASGGGNLGSLIPVGGWAPGSHDARHQVLVNCQPVSHAIE
ncbi:hypothetical protein E2C01_057209 [Portunus trituberculatus]|uniref:Uncharacterized protein n=1 Tax=Portunus trituberculatus TaxID=210409 RepID=A0A5B7H0G1_PORTR|nr:hypothetical protein [Portunus trituberculatus]